MTPLQRKVLDYVEAEIQRTRGVPPSLEQIAKAMDMKSRSGAHRVIAQLVDAGHLVRIGKRARGLALPRAAAPVCPKCGRSSWQ